MFQGSDDRDAMKRIAEQEGVKLSLMPSSGGAFRHFGGHGRAYRSGAYRRDPVRLRAEREDPLSGGVHAVRLTELPDIPTLREQDGTSPSRCTWSSLRPRLPDEVLQRLKAALDDLKRDKAFSEFAVEKAAYAARGIRHGPRRPVHGRPPSGTRHRPPADDFKTRAIRRTPAPGNQVSHAVRGGSAREQMPV